MYKIKNNEKERVLIIGLAAKSTERERELYELNELEALVKTAGAIPLEKIMQIKNKIDARYLIGKGKAHSLKDIDADILLFNECLSPGQVVNLEELTGKKVLDRRDIILDIFAQHAATKAAKIEVELAQLSFRLTRLIGRGKELSRLGGGIGTRGPGEKKLEVDRRKIRTRIDHLKKELDSVKKTRKVQRARRDDMFTISLLGYTNTGKTTLLNAITHAHARVNNQLFVTLDPLTRIGITNTGNKFLVTDTVGFIGGIPTELMASFKATLEEAVASDLRLVLLDASSEKYQEEFEETINVMKELEIHDAANIIIFNKIDKIYDSVLLNHLRTENNNALFISAKRKTGIDNLLNRIDDYKKRIGY